jgi:hypothetical protein
MVEMHLAKAVRAGSEAVDDPQAKLKTVFGAH